ncbi:MAG: lipid-A-disaccharide synthase [Candidatus Omnitrophica bacterium]|nr:lipid-A-disaccharide synthase [Candidatus Omnitrophota bacterium]
MAKKILIVSGEASGDLHAASLTREILKLLPGTKILAVGGENLRQAGAEIIYDIKGLSVIGLFDVLKKLPAFFALKKFLLERIRQEGLDAVVFVDFSGFNLRLARELKNSVPAVYYVSPQVWASRPGRVKTVKQYIKKMIVLFKFEEEFYKKYGVDAGFVGHPLLDIVRPEMQKQELLDNLKFSADRPTIALLPGSRKQEVRNILPVMLEAAKLINDDLTAQFVVAKSTSVDWQVYDQIIRRSGGIEVKTVEGKTYDCLNIADFCLVCSGTATLETAIMQKPFCLIYKMSLLNYLLYRPQVRLPYIGMANIVAGKRVVPEFIQFNANPKKIAQEALRILRDKKEFQKITEDLAAVRSSLGPPGAARRAAEIITGLLSSRSIS